MARNENLPRGAEQSRMPARRRMLPFSPFQRMFDRMLEDIFPETHGLFNMPAESGGMEAGLFSPRTEVTENDKEVRIRLEVPGMNENDIDVSMTREGILVRGERRNEREEEREGSRYYSEFSYGMFERFIPLSAEIDEGKIDAKFEQGVLKLSLPKTAEAQGRMKKIPIKGDAGARPSKPDVEAEKGGGKSSAG